MRIIGAYLKYTRNFKSTFYHFGIKKEYDDGDTHDIVTSLNFVYSEGIWVHSYLASFANFRQWRDLGRLVS